MIELAKFSRPGCRPCVAVSHYIDELKETGALDGVVIAHYNTDNLSEEDLAKFKISSVPVLLFKRNGLEITRITGMTDQETIVDCVKMAREER